jgi:hypothetical protein
MTHFDGHLPEDCYSDTRAFPFIPAWHDLWHCVTSGFLASLVIGGIVGAEDARRMGQDPGLSIGQGGLQVRCCMTSAT